MPPSSGRLAVVIDQPRAPFAADRRIVATRDQARVLDRDHRLVIVAVERPGLDLALGAFAAVQQLVERMQPVIAPRADVAQRRFQLCGVRASWRASAWTQLEQSRASIHRITARSPCRPHATSQPAASTRGALGRAVDQDRIGVVDVHEDAPRRKPARAPQASRPSPSIGMWPMRRPVFVAGAGADHLVVANSVPSNRITSARASRSRIAGVTAAAPGT